PMGLEALAATLNVEVDTLKEVYEPYLLRTGLLVRTSRGRVASDLAYRHLGYESRVRGGLFDGYVAEHSEDQREDNSGGSQGSS
ncbi:MAG: Holliday junction DNA helicase RuvB C-terminal domain-containing protein, partial [Pseudothermotoga sp.]|uniref:Holliday junction DNA helicase RuvB C-terminal domain-containing protein n=1 Tax=Pseudothermotoga sp. TaxID=2033661 RepID=UPI0025891F44